ncbi:MAG: DNA-3-methyladenine glycosylase [Marinilabiliales bacterium]
MKLDYSFYQRDALIVAKELLGKKIVKNSGNSVKHFIITETEAYLGEEDLACHASKGKTPRTEVMYREGGFVYVYLIYGMYWLLNVVTGPKDYPQAVLIRCCDGFDGPGKVGKALDLDKSYYGENLVKSNRIWIEDTDINVKYITKPRVNIDYAGKKWASKKWRFILDK